MSMVLSHRIEDLAATVGRLRRRLDPESLNGMIADDAAAHVDLLDAMTFPTAGELCAQLGDVDHALAITDARQERIRKLLAPGPNA